jgi:hypothetical protein
VKRFTGRNGVIQVRATTRAGKDVFSVYVNVRRNSIEEEEWAGTYEVTYGPAAKPKANTKRGTVKCFVE